MPITSPRRETGARSATSDEIAVVANPQPTPCTARRARSVASEPASGGGVAREEGEAARAKGRRPAGRGRAPRGAASSPRRSTRGRRRSHLALRRPARRRVGRQDGDEEVEAEEEDRRRGDEEDERAGEDAAFGQGRSSRSRRCRSSAFTETWISRTESASDTIIRTRLAAKSDLSEDDLPEEEDEHADDADEEARDSRGLHVLDQVDPVPEVVDLLRDERVRVLAVTRVEAPHERGEGEEAVRVGEEEERHRGEEERGGREAQLHVERTIADAPRELPASVRGLIRQTTEEDDDAPARDAPRAAPGPRSSPRSESTPWRSRRSGSFPCSRFPTLPAGMARCGSSRSPTSRSSAT